MKHHLPKPWKKLRLPKNTNCLCTSMMNTPNSLWMEIMEALHSTGWCMSSLCLCFWDSTELAGQMIWIVSCSLGECPLFFTGNRPNYSRWMVRYFLNLLNVDDTHPGVKEMLTQGALSVRRTKNSSPAQLLTWHWNKQSMLMLPPANWCLFIFPLRVCSDTMDADKKCLKWYHQ